LFAFYVNKAGILIITCIEDSDGVIAQMSLLVSLTGGCHYRLLPRESIQWYVLKEYTIKISSPA